MTTLPKEILNAIDNDRLVLWIGAGFSQSRLNLPNWRGMVEDILSKILEKDFPEHFLRLNERLQSNEKDVEIAVLGELSKLDEEVSLISKRSVKTLSSAYIFHNFKKLPDANDLSLTDFHTLWKISHKIITTNYDMGLDQTRPVTVDKVVWNNQYQLSQLTTDKPFYFKLHGCATDPESCILFPEQYQTLYRGTDKAHREDLTDPDTPVKFLLKQLLAGHTVLFIGFGVEEPIDYLIQYIYDLLGYIGKTHFLLTKKGAEDRVWGNLEKWEIDDWSEIPELLLVLARHKQERVQPFFRGKNPQNFTRPYAGREKDVAYLDRFFQSSDKNFLFLHGMGGVGKSHLLWEIWKTLSQKPVYYRLGPADSLDAVAAELGYGDFSSLPPERKNKAFLDKARQETQALVFDDFYEVRDEQLYRTLLDLRDLPGVKTLIISRTLPADFIQRDFKPVAHEITELPKEAFFDCMRVYHEETFPDKYELSTDLLEICWNYAQGYPLGGQFLLNLREFDPNFERSLQEVGALNLERDPEREHFVSRLVSVILDKANNEAERQLAGEAAVFNEPLPYSVFETLPSWNKEAFHSLWRRKHLFFQQTGELFGAHPLVRSVLINKLGNSEEAHAKAGEYYEQLAISNDQLQLARLEKALYHFGKAGDVYWQEFKERMRPQFLESTKNLVDANAQVTIERLLFRLKLNPEDLAAMNELGMAYRRNGNALKSIEILEHAVSLGNLQSINELGISYRAAGQIDKSFQLLEQAIERPPRNVILLNGLSYCYQESGQISEAISLIQKAITIQPYNIILIIRLRQLLKQSNHSDDTTSILQKAVQLQPENVILLNELGKSLREAKRLNDAINILQKSVDKGSIQSMNELGITLREAKRLDDAIDILQKAVDRGSIQSMNELGITLREAQRLDDAIDILQQAVDKGSIQSMNELGITLREAKRLDDAIDILQKAVDRGSIQSMNELGITLREAQQLDDAIDILQKAVDKGSVQSMNELGITLREAKRLNDAIDILQKAVDKGEIPSMNELGITLREAKRLEDAIDILQKAVDKGNIQSMNELGITFREAKRLDDAIDILQKAVDKGNVQSMNELGITFREAKRLDDAIDILQKAVDRGSVQSMNELGITFREAKRLDDAIDILQKTIDKGEIPPMNELGITFREAKRFDDAIDILQKAADRGNVQSMNELGITFREVRRLDESIDILQKAAQLQPYNVIILNELGKSFREAKRLDDAIDILQKSVDRGNIQSMNELGITFREAKRLDDAIDILQKAVDKSSIQSMNELGITLREAKRYDEAIALWEKGRQMQPQNAFFKLNLLQIHLFFQPNATKAKEIFWTLPPNFPKSTQQRQMYTDIVEHLETILACESNEFKYYRLYLDRLAYFQSWDMAVHFLEKLTRRHTVREFRAWLGLALSQPSIGRAKEGLPILKETLQQLANLTANPWQREFYYRMAVGYLDALFHKGGKKELIKAFDWLEKDLDGLPEFEEKKSQWLNKSA